jgi:hypothetical protein
MEIIGLDSNYQPERIIENHGSFVWAEKYATAGEFVFESTNIARAIRDLPLESVISLRDSTVPMTVEVYEIEKPKNAAPKIKITGRSFDCSALERRVSADGREWAEPDPVPEAYKISAQKESDAAYKLLREVLGDGDRYGYPPDEATLMLPAVSPFVAEDAIPDIDLILPRDFEAGTTNEYEIPIDELYATVLKLIAINFRGIKAVRPLPGQTKIGIEIYNGVDRRNEINFNARLDQLDSAKYLLSKRGSKNVAYSINTTGASIVLKNAGPVPTGLERRVMAVDAGDDNRLTGAVQRNNMALIGLYQKNATALFDGEIAEQVAKGYNKSYFLGDILKLTGDYGLSQDVRVAEFIRSSDQTGDKSYPTFEAIS